MEAAIKGWHETGKLDARVNFLLDNEKIQTDKYASVVKVDKVWKGQGSRKWKHGQSDGFFVQFESPVLCKLWILPSSTEKGWLVCRMSIWDTSGVYLVLYVGTMDPKISIEMSC
ncbi:uncharacterized protein [Aristolochia californica]|uniref:uncharacterized protein n=1 Tax=Aristolochia californica TaxID=171875 RepID=UPI0035D941D8